MAGRAVGLRQRVQDFIKEGRVLRGGRRAFTVRQRGKRKKAFNEVNNSWLKVAFTGTSVNLLMFFYLYADQGGNAC